LQTNSLFTLVLILCISGIKISQVAIQNYPDPQILMGLDVLWRNHELAQ